MVMTFDQSSATVFPRIRAVSKVGAGAQSTGITIRASTQPYVGFDCVRAAACRWGDYAAATPDPAAATGGTVGQVWVTSQWTAGGTSTSQANWRTWNASVTP
ncbi:MAG: hypothetical protein HYX34_06435 [Actinobacteria bacterium]|nr:hypothetical protein [Actinomycetota bacterium]